MDAPEGDVDDRGQPETNTHLHRVDGLSTDDGDEHSCKWKARDMLLSLVLDIWFLC